MVRRLPFFFILIFFFTGAIGQDTAYQWKASSNKIDEKTYELVFKSNGNPNWQLFAANQSINDAPAVTLEFRDSSIKIVPTFEQDGESKKIISAIFDNASFNIYEGPFTIKAKVQFPSNVPASLSGKLLYFYGKGDAFYPGSLEFTVPLKGGVTDSIRIKIESFDLKNPVSNAGDDGTAGKSLWGIFLLGLLGGFIALLTPCVFPMIPLTVSFFTKQAANRSKGIANAMLYGFFIFLIYILLSLPFHFVGGNNPEILNNISTNVWLNLTFFAIFVVFAISFFGYFEITLPGAAANTVNAKSGIGNIAGIFFMALTLAIVSFSCTGPILGSLLVGALSSDGGPMQLTFGMGGFGFGLALPFAIFALFPGWLHSLPKSGGWMNSVKVVLGFLELAMAVKFFSNADLVKQWGLLKRETFIGIWVVLGILILLYLFGKIKFPHDSPVKKYSKPRITFIVLFAAATLYLIPGLTNTKWANLRLISGFPPPLCYSLYSHPVNCEKGIEPLRDYEEAVRVAKKENKPILIDFTGWACVNCRRMEENVWTDQRVHDLMRNEFIVVSLYVDERRLLPVTKQFTYTTKTGTAKKIVTVGDRWATFQSENFDAVSQPQYATVSPDEKILTRTKAYTPNPVAFAQWLQAGIDAFKQLKAQSLTDK